MNFCNMKETVKPIKRSKELAPLSREHHDGLLFSWKIKQGLDNKTPVEELRKYTMWYWRHHIKPHFFQEEKILLPHIPEGNPMIKRLKDEHDHIRELIIGLDEQADKRSLQVLCDLINLHIRFEERELFAYLEKTLSADKLNEIFTQLEKHPVCHDEPAPAGWTPEFWARKKVS